MKATGGAGGEYAISKVRGRANVTERHMVATFRMVKYYIATSCGANNLRRSRGTQSGMDCCDRDRRTWYITASDSKVCGGAPGERNNIFEKYSRCFEEGEGAGGVGEACEERYARWAEIPGKQW